MIQMQDELLSRLIPSQTGEQTWLLKPLRGCLDLPVSPICGSEFLLGSAHDCDLEISVAGIAEHHCRLRPEKHRLLVVAHDSRTWINDNPVQKAHLKSGDRLTIGPVTFQLEAVVRTPQEQGELHHLNSHLARYLQRAVREGRIDTALSVPGNSPTWPDTLQVLDEVQESIRTTRQQLWKQQQQLHSLQGSVQTTEDEILSAPLPKAAKNIPATSLRENREQISQNIPSPAEEHSFSRQVEKLLRLKSKLRTLHLRRQQKLSEAEDRLHDLRRQTEKQQENLHTRLLELEQQEAARIEQEQHWHNQLQTLTGETARLQQQLDAADQDNHKLTATLASLEDQLRNDSDLHEKNLQFEKQIEELTSYAQDLDTQAQLYKTQSEELDQLLHNCQRQLSEQSDRYESRLQALEATELSLQAEVEQHRQREQALEAELQQGQLEREELILKLDRVQQQLIELENEKEGQELTQLKLRKELEQLQASAGPATPDHSELDSEWERLSAERDRILQVRQELEEERAAFRQAHEDLRSVREEMEAEQRSIQEQSEELMAESLRIHSLRSDLDERQQQLETQTRSLEEQLALLTEQTVPAEHTAESADSDSGFQELPANTEESADKTDFVESPSDNGPSLEALNDLFSQLETSSFLNPGQFPESEVELSDDDSTHSLQSEEFSSEPPVEADSTLTPQDDSDAVEQDDELGNLRKELAQMFGFGKQSPAQHPDEEPELADLNDDPHGIEEQLRNETDEDQAALLQTALFTDNEPVDQSDEATLEEAEESSGRGGDLVVDDIEDTDSVAAYMERLFARTNGKQNYTEPAVYQPAKQRHASRPESTAAKAAPATQPAAPAMPSSAQVLERIRPVAQLDREMMKREIESLRDVANQTARNALATHAWKQVKLKMLASGILTLVSGISAVVLISSPYWSPISYQNYGWLTLLLTAISATELFRSRLVLLRLKQSKKQQTQPERTADISSALPENQADNEPASQD